MGNTIIVLPPLPGAAPDWRSLGWLGDQWLLALLRLSAHWDDGASPLMFTGGHALELYLKSAYARVHGTDATIAKGHKLVELWDEVATMAGFPAAIKLRPVLLSGNLLFSTLPNPDSLSKDDRKHLTVNASLYRTIRHLQDLKYLGTVMKTLPGAAQGYVYQIPDMYMINLLAAIRHWLGHGVNNTPVDASISSEFAKLGITPASAAERFNRETLSYP